MGKYIHVGGNQRSASCSKEINLKVKLFPFIIFKLFPIFTEFFISGKVAFESEKLGWVGGVAGGEGGRIAVFIGAERFWLL